MKDSAAPVRPCTPKGKNGSLLPAALDQYSHIPQSTPCVVRGTNIAVGPGQPFRILTNAGKTIQGLFRNLEDLIN